ncbi:general secretion pathway protein GspB [Vibrio tubiashii]|nr:general secretion pathway protein GspB [Vibrio tubiashii]
MSKVMQALESSERSHQTSGHLYQQPGYLASVQKSRSNLTIRIALAILPPLLVTGSVCYQTYQIEKQKWLVENVAQSVIVEVPFEFQVVQAPDLGPLETTYRNHQSSDSSDGLIQAEQEVKTLVAPPASSHQGGAVSSSDDLLAGLDLSQLSPELAQRFESALNSETEQVQSQRNEQASNLSHQAERWYGKLPAMNFQTHVYSSKANKRWVKINGVEYKQGDWVNSDIELVAIEPQSCLIRFRRELIRVPALYDWKG